MSISMLSLLAAPLFVIIAAIIIGVVILVIILNGAERRIPVQYSKKMQGRKMMGGQSSHIPLSCLWSKRIRPVSMSMSISWKLIIWPAVMWTALSMP